MNDLRNTGFFFGKGIFENNYELRVGRNLNDTNLVCHLTNKCRLYWRMKTVSELLVELSEENPLLIHYSEGTLPTSWQLFLIQNVHTSTENFTLIDGNVNVLDIPNKCWSYMGIAVHDNFLIRNKCKILPGIITSQDLLILSYRYDISELVNWYQVSRKLRCKHDSEMKLYEYHCNELEKQFQECKFKHKIMKRIVSEQPQQKNTEEVDQAWSDLEKAWKYPCFNETEFDKILKKKHEEELAQCRENLADNSNFDGRKCAECPILKLHFKKKQFDEKWKKYNKERLAYWNHVVQQ